MELPYKIKCPNCGEEGMLIKEYKGSAWGHAELPETIEHTSIEWKPDKGHFCKKCLAVIDDDRASALREQAYNAWQESKKAQREENNDGQ